MPATLTWPHLASISFFLPIHFSNTPTPKMLRNLSFYSSKYFISPVASIFLHLGISVNFKGWEQSAREWEKNVWPFSQSFQILQPAEIIIYEHIVHFQHSKQKIQIWFLTRPTPKIRNALYLKTKAVYSSSMPCFFCFCLFFCFVFLFFDMCCCLNIWFAKQILQRSICSL